MKKRKTLKKTAATKLDFFGWVEDEQSFLNMFSDSSEMT
jgi:hypothetical protein